MDHFLNMKLSVHYRDDSQVFVSYMYALISRCYPQIVSFTNVILIALVHSITYMMFILYMPYHCLHLGSLHFVTLGMCSCLFENLALSILVVGFYFFKMIYF